MLKKTLYNISRGGGGGGQVPHLACGAHTRGTAFTRLELGCLSLKDYLQTSK